METYNVSFFQNVNLLNTVSNIFVVSSVKLVPVLYTNEQKEVSEVTFLPFKMLYHLHFKCVVLKNAITVGYKRTVG